MLRLTFIDDDKTELDAFRTLIGTEYEFTAVHWPNQVSQLHSERPPDIFVSDLYLPSRTGDEIPSSQQVENGKKAAQIVASRFLTLYEEVSGDHKARLKKTMSAISEAYELLQLQWEALGQSPENGFDLFTQLRARYPNVPFVFYSRKVTPEDVTHALSLGADDVIRKDGLPLERVLSRLAAAQASRRQQAILPVTSPKGELVTGNGTPDKTFLDRVKALADSSKTWVELGSKSLGLLAAVFAFLLARDKLLDWVRRPTNHQVASGAGGWDSLSVVVGWYLIVWLLLVTGGILESAFTELWRAAIKFIHFVKPPNAVERSKPPTGLEQTVPKLFRLAWEICVILLAVVPALAYTIRLLRP